MRKWIDLFEKAIVIDTEDTQDMTVHVSPTKSDLLAFINNQQHEPLVRGIVSGKSYFWSGYDAYHYDVAEYFGLNLRNDGVPLVVSTNIETLKENDDWEFNIENPYVFAKSGSFFLTVPEKMMGDARLTRLFPSMEIVYRIAIQNGQQVLVGSDA